MSGNAEQPQAGKRVRAWALVAISALFAAGATWFFHPHMQLCRLELGMSPEAVIDELGVDEAKLFFGGWSNELHVRCYRLGYGRVLHLLLSASNTFVRGTIEYDFGEINKLQDRHNKAGKYVFPR